MTDLKRFLVFPGCESSRCLPWILCLVLTTVPTLAQWPEWRGPNGQGHVPDSVKGLPLTWSEEENVKWKTTIPGRGWSTPVIEGDMIWMTTAEETKADPEDVKRRLQENTGSQPLTLLKNVRLQAVGVNRQSGSVVRIIELFNIKNPQWVHKLNSYASPTPIIASGRLYCHFGTFGTACIDTRNGKVLWRNADLNIMHENGPGSSPVLWKNLIIFHLDGSDTQSIAALDKDNGRLVWRTDRSGKMHSNPQLKKSYGTPIILEVQGKHQIISPAADWLYAYHPETGKELWKLNYESLGFSITSRPVAGHGMIFMSTGFMRPQMLGIRLKGENSPEIVWRYKKGVPNISSPLLVGNELYFVNDSGGIVTCLDALTGKEHYRERLGGNHNASPVFADGKILLFSREGTTSILKPGTVFQKIADNRLDGQFMASPAAADKALFLRTDLALYRIESGDSAAGQ